MTHISPKNETGLFMAFLHGMATPVVTLGCSLLRREKPEWLTKEFSPYKPLRNISFAFGLATGVGGLLAGMFQVEKCLVDQFMLSSQSKKTSFSTPIIPSPPSLYNEAEIEDLGEYRFQNIPYVIPNSSQAAKPPALMV